MTNRKTAALWLCMMCVTSAHCVANAADVRFEIAAPRTLSPANSHKWLETIKAVAPAGVRIFTATGGEQPEIKRIGPERYQVTGIITARNELQLPGGSFAMHERGRLKGWVENIAQHLPMTSGPAQVALGLTAEQLSQLRRELAVPVTGATAGRETVQVVSEIVAAVRRPIGTTPAAGRALQGNHPVREELRGLASGTTLAAILRPLGLVLSPNVDATGEVTLVIDEAAAAREHWPIGWPYEGRPDQIAPKLLDRLEVEIEPLPLDTVMSALQERLQVPLVWDQNGMARERIDPQFDEVSHAAGKALYAQVVRRVLYQAGLKYELRVDEAGKPLLWITPIPRNG